MSAPTPPLRRPSRCRRVATAAVALAAALAMAGCSDRSPEAGAAADGLIALVTTADGPSLVGWEDGDVIATPIGLPEGDVTWIASGRADVLVATLANGRTATSNPVRLGKKLAWRPVRAAGPTGDPVAGPEFFATWDPEGGRFASLAGDLAAGDDIRLVLVDPTLRTSFEIPLDRPVVAGPPAWIDADRLVVVTGEPARPAVTIVDTTTGDVSDGPAGDRLVATSANGRRVATVAGRGEPVVVHDTAAWLDGDGSSIASIEPPGGATTAISFALDATGERLAIAWATDDGSVRIAVHLARADWRRSADPEVGRADGVVVAWRR